MAIKVVEPNFSRLGFETEGEIPFNTPLDLALQQTLSRLLAWSYDKEQWDFVAIDTDGRLLVSTSPTKADTNNSSQASVTTTSAVALTANADRKQAVIQNTGASDCYLGFGETASTSDGFLLVAGATYIEDVWLGAIQAITASGSTTLNIQDME